MKGGREVGWEGADKVLQGLESAHEAWKVFKHHWDQRYPDSMKENWKLIQKLWML